MKNQVIIYSIFIVMLSAALITAGCTSRSSGDAMTTPTQLPPSVPTAFPSGTQTPSTCGFTTCHGLDLACGTNAPQMCTMEYRIGDRCRQYASCDTGAGGCSLVLGPQFIACKTCVEKCQTAAGPDSLSAFSCEEKC